MNSNGCDPGQTNLSDMSGIKMFGMHVALWHNQSFSVFSKTISGRSLPGPRHTMEMDLYNGTVHEVDPYMTHVQKSDVRMKPASQA